MRAGSPRLAAGASKAERCVNFLMILNDPGIARHVCSEPDVVPFVDLEVLGKGERQGHLDSWKSRHQIEDVARIREAVPDSHLLVRINPLHDGTAAELDAIIARGADSVMLPMFRTRDELVRFLDLLNGRAHAWPLVETAAALRAIPDIVATGQLDRLHIGLNDLHLDLGLEFMFQPLSRGLLDAPAAALNAAGIRFGFGGIARSNEGIISPEFLLGEHVRLGSDTVILSRTFHRGVPTAAALAAEMDFGTEIAKLRAIHADFQALGSAALEENRRLTAKRVGDAVTLLRRNRAGDPSPVSGA